MYPGTGNFGDLAGKPPHL